MYGVVGTVLISNDDNLFVEIITPKLQFRDPKNPFYWHEKLCHRKATAEFIYSPEFQLKNIKEIKILKNTNIHTSISIQSDRIPCNVNVRKYNR